MDGNTNPKAPTMANLALALFKGGWQLYGIIPEEDLPSKLNNWFARYADDSGVPRGLDLYYHDSHCEANPMLPMGCKDCTCTMYQRLRKVKEELDFVKERHQLAATTALNAALNLEGANSRLSALLKAVDDNTGPDNQILQPELFIGAILGVIGENRFTMGEVEYKVELADAKPRVSFSNIDGSVIIVDPVESLLEHQIV